PPETGLKLEEQPDKCIGSAGNLRVLASPRRNGLPSWPVLPEIDSRRGKIIDNNWLELVIPEK
ncbi:MAG: hypothetical protein V1794_00470, partial [Candidatus Glassbacteria bacterium]